MSLTPISLKRIPEDHGRKEFAARDEKCVCEIV